MDNRVWMSMAGVHTNTFTRVPLFEKGNVLKISHVWPLMWVEQLYNGQFYCLISSTVQTFGCNLHLSAKRSPMENPSNRPLWWAGHTKTDKGPVGTYESPRARWIQLVNKSSGWPTESTGFVQGIYELFQMRTWPCLWTDLMGWVDLMGCSVYSQTHAHCDFNTWKHVYCSIST